ncbi:hypothetical protein V2J09_006423 [Rumex salicifolius]
MFTGMCKNKVIYFSNVTMTMPPKLQYIKTSVKNAVQQTSPKAKILTCYSRSKKHNRADCTSTKDEMKTKKSDDNNQNNETSTEEEETPTKGIHEADIRSKKRDDRILDLRTSSEAQQNSSEGKLLVYSMLV